MPISALDFRYLSPTGRNLGLMGKLKISSELLTPLDYWNLAWASGLVGRILGNLKISSELLKPLD